MNKQMQQLCQWVLAAAKKAGANDCRVAYSRSRRVEITYRDRKPETVKEASTQGLSLQFYVSSRFSRQSTSDLRKEALGDFIRNGVETTRLLGEDPFRTLPDPALYARAPFPQVEVNDPAYAGIAPGERHDRVKALEDACLKHGGDKVITLTTVSIDDDSNTLCLTSNGFQGEEAATSFTTYALMTVRDQGDRKPMAIVAVSQRFLSALPSADAFGKMVNERAERLIGAKKIATERLPIIVENQATGNLLGMLMDPLSGRAIQQKSSCLADKKGQPIASDCLTVIDDPLLARGQGSYVWDGDGFPARRRTVVEGGVLKDFFVDWYYSRKLGWQPTTDGASNVIIPPGKRSLEAIMKDVGRGVLVTGFIGGNSNSATGDFSIGITGVLFENGALKQPVSEMNIADNHLRFWKKAKEVANDPWPHDAVRCPSLLFEDVVVSGT